MSEVSAVQIPLHNICDPALWFIMCESTFALATPKPITESVAKYNYIVANLPPNTASLVRDILMHPDGTDPYAQIKNELINRPGESFQQEARLPSSVQTILTAVSDLTLNKAADIAERILKVSPSPIETFSVSNKKEQTSKSKLFREIEKINERIDLLSISRGRSPYRPYLSYLHKRTKIPV
ncbi:uncharacterized protein TNCV_1605051 [Trichonephila clavipes]|nr:uncharacterized protein TNCV_1605051 [Trichonephila clavipes]